MRSSDTPTSRATCATGIAWHSAITKASITSEKPEPGRAHGGWTWPVLPHAVQATRGRPAWMKALNWKKCRCCQRRSIRSWIGWSAAPQAGHPSRCAWHSTAKWMAPSGRRKSTEVTAQGGLRPRACVKRGSIQPHCRTGSDQARHLPHEARLILKVDHTHEDQELLGYKTLNLNNGFHDPTFTREIVYNNYVAR